ncbi:DUF2809 domain-containing protein [Mucilaginibacter gynuensis]|uniref:DUF2809 domain-containing protein n=1 Tax=Mucilaginibacter gynuensis TaxID=1302236 RepID=A0ABP8HAS1_9SPHI
MLKQRLVYLALTLATIIIGLLSRHYAAIPLFVGDILYAVMVYFIVCFLFVNAHIKYVVIVALVFCYVIEFSQLYQAIWINDIRHTLFGRLVLGAGFLWSDLLCYTVGVSIAMLVDRWFLKIKNDA